MAGYIIREREQTLVLPAAQVDSLLRQADGDAALLYLCLMRADAALTAEQLMERLHMSALRLQAARTTLEKLGLIQAQEPAPLLPAQERPEYTTEDMASMLRDGEFHMLIQQTEQALGKKLSTADLRRMANLRHEIGLPVDVIFLLIRHCIDQQERRFGQGRRPTVRQIEAEGCYWAKCGIFDQESAARYLRRDAQRREKMADYMKVLLLGQRRPVEDEEKYIGRWIDWGFSPEAVGIAYSKTVMKKQGMDWKYLNGILRRWNEQGLHTEQQIREADSRPAPRKEKNKGGSGMEEYMKW